MQSGVRRNERLLGVWAVLCLLVLPVPIRAQSNSGELRLRVTDPVGLAVKSTVELVSEVNRFHRSLVTDEQGLLTAKLLPFGLYRVEVAQDGFAPFSDTVEIRSASPQDCYWETRRVKP